MCQNIFLTWLLLPRYILQVFDGFLWTGTKIVESRIPVAILCAITHNLVKSLIVWNFLAFLFINDCVFLFAACGGCAGMPASARCIRKQHLRSQNPLLYWSWTWTWYSSTTTHQPLLLPLTSDYITQPVVHHQYFHS